LRADTSVVLEPRDLAIAVAVKHFKRKTTTVRVSPEQV
jgi:hypothetical protein